MAVEDFTNGIDECSGEQELFAAFAHAASQEGFDRFAYAAAGEHVRPSSGIVRDGPEPPIIASNYPAEWLQHYRDEGYVHVDPVFAEAPNALLPFTWDSITSKSSLPRRQRRLFEEARSFGLASGVTVPLHGPWGSVALVSFASDSRAPIAKARIRRAAILAGQVHIAFAEMTDAAFGRRYPDLSTRERECLRWTAAGKSSWEIGIILTLSENTINFHLKNAMKKLGTSSRTVAALRAIQSGQIGLSTLA